MNILVFILQLMLIFGWFYQTSEAFTPWMKPHGDTSITNTRRTKFKVTRKTVADPGEPPPPPYIFRPKKNIFWRPGPSPLSQGLDDRPSPPPPSLIWRARSSTDLVVKLLTFDFFKMLGVANREISHQLSSGRKALVHTGCLKLSCCGITIQTSFLWGRLLN